MTHTSNLRLWIGRGVCYFALLSILTAVAGDEVQERLKADVEFLCSPECRGREVPGLGGEQTAAWLVEQMTAIGLAPGFSDTSYTQSVTLRTGYLDTAATTLTLIRGNMKKVFHWGEGFYVLPRHAEPRDIGSELIDCGYGIEAPELNRHDLQAGAPNLALLVRTGADIPNAGRHAMTPFKAAAARRQSAMMMLVRTSPEETFPPAEVKEKLTEANELKVGLPGEEPEMPVVYVDGGLIQEFLNPDSLTSPACVQLNLAFRDGGETSAKNVCGMFPGETDEWVVIGAHYDHLGVKDSTAESGLVYYPGANDNASGVAGLLEVCRIWRLTTGHKRGLIAVLFTAEEDGALGSRYFAANLPAAKEKIDAVINLDMIGGDGYASMREAMAHQTGPDPDYAAVLYTAATPEFKPIIAEAGAVNTLKIDPIEVSGFPFTDAGSFSDIQLPTLHLFSGFDSEYSSSNDTPDNLNWSKLERMTMLALQLVFELSEYEGTLGFDSTIKPAVPGMRY